jgi:agmatine deiminase
MSVDNKEGRDNGTVRIPAEWELHACCWMAWAVHREWGKAINKVKRELSEVIHTITEYEPVRLLASKGPGLREAQREFSSCSNVTVIGAPVDDIWMGDIAPTFTWRGYDRELEPVAIDWNFNGWGGTHERPPRQATACREPNPTVTSSLRHPARCGSQFLCLQLEYNC